MSTYIPYIIPGILFLAVSYVIVNFIFDLLLRGFTPFIPSRPWVIKQIMRELDFSGKKRPKRLLAFSSGRSGFFLALKKELPDAEFVGVEPGFFPYLVAKVQSMLRLSGIKIIHRNVRDVRVKEFDFIYNHLYPDKMKGLGKKLRFECRPGTRVISTGFNIPYLEPYKVIDLPDRKGRLDFLSRNQKLFQRKSKKYKKEKKAFFYEI